MDQSVYAVATMDTKGHELAFVAERLRAAGLPVVTVDVGTKDPPVVPADVDRAKVAACDPAAEGYPAAVSRSDRGQAVAAMSHSLECYLRRECQAGRVLGVIGIGGSGGTSLITTAMRALPIGLPKLMVSTV